MCVCYGLLTLLQILKWRAEQTKASISATDIDSMVKSIIKHFSSSSSPTTMMHCKKKLLHWLHCGGRRTVTSISICHNALWESSSYHRTVWHHIVVILLYRAEGHVTLETLLMFQGREMHAGRWRLTPVCSGHGTRPTSGTCVNKINWTCSMEQNHVRRVKCQNLGTWTTV